MMDHPENFLCIASTYCKIDPGSCIIDLKIYTICLVRWIFWDMKDTNNSKLIKVLLPEPKIPGNACGPDLYNTLS